MKKNGHLLLVVSIKQVKVQERANHRLIWLSMILLDLEQRVDATLSMRSKKVTNHQFSKNMNLPPQQEVDQTGTQSHPKLKLTRCKLKLLRKPQDCTKMKRFLSMDQTQLKKRRASQTKSNQRHLILKQRKSRSREHHQHQGQR